VADPATDLRSGRRSKGRRAFTPIDPSRDAGPGRGQAAGKVPGARRREAGGLAGAAKDEGSRRKVPRPKGSRRSGLTIAALVAASAALVLLSFLALPELLVVRAFEVKGNHRLSAEELVAIAGIKPGLPLLSVDRGAAEARLRTEPAIKSVRLSLSPPDIVRIDVVERNPVAFVLVESEGRGCTVAVDASGLAYARRPVAEFAGLPLLSGFRFADWRPGQGLPEFALPTLAALAAMEAADPALLSLFSEIRFERSAWGEVELVFYPLHFALPVRTGPRPDAPLLRSVVLVLDALATGRLASGGDELDFRTGTIVFRTKEGHSG